VIVPLGAAVVATRLREAVPSPSHAR
jgi:hypothetical protein